MNADIATALAVAISYSLSVSGRTAAYTFSLNVVEPESIPEPSVFMGFIVSSLSFLLKKRR